MNKLIVFLSAIIAAIFSAFAAAVSAAAVSPSHIVSAASGSDVSSGRELSIPENIGTHIPEAEHSMPVIGFIMWAIVAVAVITALIVIFANLGGANVSPDASVRRNRYRKKPPQKSKLLHDKYYRK